MTGDLTAALATAAAGPWRPVTCLATVASAVTPAWPWGRGGRCRPRPAVARASYATTLPFVLARRLAADPARVAAALAAALRPGRRGTPGSAPPG